VSSSFTLFGAQSTVPTASLVRKTLALKASRFGVTLHGLLGVNFANPTSPSSSRSPPSPDSQLLSPKSATSTPFFFAGSVFVVDGKRCTLSGRPFIAVYLRRLPPLAAAAALGGALAPAAAGTGVVEMLARGLGTDPGAMAAHHRFVAGARGADPASLTEQAAMGAAPGMLALGRGVGGGTFLDPRDQVQMKFAIRLCGCPGSPTSQSVCGRSQAGKVFGSRAGEQSWGWQTFVDVRALCPAPLEGDGELRLVIQCELM
jgi:hypothetical protein